MRSPVLQTATYVIPVFKLVAKDSSTSHTVIVRSGYDSCEIHYDIENYAVFVDGGAWFLLTPLKAPVNGWTVLCLPCGGPQFKFLPELAPHYPTASFSPSSDSSTSTSASWCCIHQNQCPQKTCNFGSTTFLFIATTSREQILSITDTMHVYHKLHTFTPLCKTKTGTLLCVGSHALVFVRGCKEREMIRFNSV